MEDKGKFAIGPLGSLNQVVKALGKTIRAMADGTISTADGSRICNGLSIMRQCLETATLERLENRLGELERGGNATPGKRGYNTKDTTGHGPTADDRAPVQPH
jgi:hypothetical protein